MKLLITISILFSTLIYSQNFYCSAFVINGKNSLLGKNLDWELGNGIIIINPSEFIKRSIYDDEGRNTWRSKHLSLTFNHFGVNQPLGGINDAGLAIEELSVWPVQYPNLEDKIELTEFEWIQYQLDNYSTVEEVILNIKETMIRKFYFGLHYIVLDKKGNAAIIEFIEGVPKIYQRDSLLFPILTNNNYLELNKYSLIRPNEQTLPFDVNTSQDRFLIIKKLINELENNKSDLTYLDAFAILDSASVTDTKWSIVYNTRDHIIHFKTYLYNSIRTISLDDLNTREDYYSYLNINSNNMFKFERLTKELNSSFLDNLKKNLIQKMNAEENKLVTKIEILIERSSKYFYH